MVMKSLANQRDKQEIAERAQKIQPSSQRRWGKMTAHQMLCHLCDSFRGPLGSRHLSTGKIAVRVPGHAVSRGLAAAAGHALTSTSANISGEPPSSSADVVAAALGGVLDVLIDAGPTPGGEPSTIVDATGRVPVLVRAGAIAWERVLEFSSE